MTSCKDRGRWVGPGGLALSLLLAVSLAACQPARVQKPEPVAQPKPPPVEAPVLAEPVEPAGPPPMPPSPRVALLLPLSGQHANIGEALLNASQLALFDIASEEFELIVRDTGGTPAGAQIAVQSALEAQASLIIGPLFATSVSAVADIALERQVNVLAFSNDTSVARPGVYVLGLIPARQVERVVAYASDRGYAKLAALAPNNAYGNATVSALQDAVYRTGSELTQVGFFDARATDASAEVRQIAQYDQRRQDLMRQRAELEARDDEASKLALKRLETLDTIGNPDFEAILLPFGGRNLMTIAPLLAFYDVDPAQVRFLGTALWDVPGLGREPALQGAWYAAPDPRPWEAFRDRYRQTFGGYPPRIASLGYDATAVVAFLSRQAAQRGELPDFSQDNLVQANGFAGTDGIFRLLPNGGSDRGLAVIQVTANGISIIDPAPTTFEALSYEDEVPIGGVVEEDPTPEGESGLGTDQPDPALSQ